MVKNSIKNENQTFWSKNYLQILSFIAVICIVVPISFYAFHFEGIISDNNKWGTFGDFFGGVANPLLSFLGLIALLFTIQLQQKELELTRRELANSAEELQLSRENGEKQTTHLITQAKKEDLLNLAMNLHSEINTLWHEQHSDTLIEVSKRTTIFQPISDSEYNGHTAKINLLHFYMVKLEEVSGGSSLLTIEIISNVKSLVSEMFKLKYVSKECFDFFNKEIDLANLLKTPWEQL